MAMQPEGHEIPLTIFTGQASGTAMALATRRWHWSYGDRYWVLETGVTAAHNGSGEADLAPVPEAPGHRAPADDSVTAGGRLSPP